MPPPLRGTSAAVADVYADTAPLIERTAAWFARRFRADADETRAVANYLFLRAYHGHDPARGGFLPRLVFLLWRGLLEERRRELRRECRHPRAALPPALPAPPGPGAFDRAGLETLLGADARLVLSLVLETPPDLAAEGGPAPPRPVLRRWLAGRLGWPRERISAAFAEIRDALAD